MDAFLGKVSDKRGELLVLEVDDDEGIDGGEIFESTCRNSLEAIDKGARQDKTEAISWWQYANS